MAIFVLVSLGPLAVACHRVPLVAPSGSALTLLVSTNSLPVNGTADLTAVVIEGAQGTSTTNASGDVVAGIGTPVHDGTVVNFSTTLGRIEPAETRTTGGRAIVQLIGDGRSGTAKVTAYSGPATSTVEIDIGAASATRLAVTANPQSLPAGGGSTTVAARLEDQQGNGVGGVEVSFSTTKGSLSATTVSTNSQGFAITTLTTIAEATVTASAGGSATALTGTVLVTLGTAK